jgi:hypothetical protein
MRNNDIEFLKWFNSVEEEALPVIDLRKKEPDVEQTQLPLDCRYPKRTRSIQKIVQVFFDSVAMTVILEEGEDLLEVLNTDDSYGKFIYEDDKIIHIWDTDDTKEQCEIVDITDRKGIVHTESH